MGRSNDVGNGGSTAPHTLPSMLFIVKMPFVDSKAHERLFVSVPHTPRFP